MTSFTIMRERTPGSFEAIHHGVGFETAEKALRWALALSAPDGPEVEHWLVIPDDVEKLERASVWTVERGKPRVTFGIYNEPVVLR